MRRTFSYIVVFGSGEGRKILAHNLNHLAETLHKGVFIPKRLRHGKLSYVFVGSEIKRAILRGSQFEVVDKSQGNYFLRMDSLLFSQYDKEMAVQRAKRVTYLRNKGIEAKRKK